MPIDSISDHPRDRHPSGMSACDQALGQFGFGGKGEGVGDMSSLSTGQIGAPGLRQVEFAVDEGVARVG